MRIGTWNLEGRWSADHGQVLVDLDCDVWLLTENQPDARPDGHHLLVSTQLMGPGKHWAGIASRWPIDPQPDPDVASVLGESGGVRFCSSVLPWPLASQFSPWAGGTHVEEMAEVVGRLDDAFAQAPVVWGGDWNQPLSGNLQGFTRGAQRVLLETVASLGLQVPTETLRGRRSGGQSSIDHVAVPDDWVVTGAGRVTVGRRLSDHDLYWVEVDPSRPEAPGP